jgi:hypothetical protein
VELVVEADRDVGFVRVFDIQRRAESTEVPRGPADIDRRSDLRFLDREFFGILTLNAIGENERVLEYEKARVDDVTRREEIV